MKAFYLSLLFITLSVALSCTKKKEEQSQTPPAGSSSENTQSFEPIQLVTNKDPIAAKSVDPNSIKSLSLWLKASSLSLKDDASVLKWTDTVSKLEFSSNNIAPLFSSTKMNGKPAVVFNNANLSAAADSFSNIFSEDSMAIFAVVSISSEMVNGELFGSDDCGRNRFLIHFPYGKNMHFQFGDSTKSEIQFPAPEALKKQPLVFGFNRTGTDVQIILLGQLNAFVKNYRVKPDISKITRFYIGNSGCGNGFRGAISEFIVSKKGLEKDAFEGVVKFLADQYKVKAD